MEEVYSEYRSEHVFQHEGQIPKPEFYVIYTGGDKKVTSIDIAIKMLANHEPEAKIQEYTGLSSSNLQDIKDGKTVLA